MILTVTKKLDDKNYQGCKQESKLHLMTLAKGYAVIEFGEDPIIKIIDAYLVKVAKGHYLCYDIELDKAGYDAYIKAGERPVYAHYVKVYEPFTNRKETP
jgi:hypothetical protein